MKKQKYQNHQIKKILQECGSSNVSDAMNRQGAMISIVARQNKVKIAGQAFTVKTAKGDGSGSIIAIERAEPGSIIVIDQQGEEIAVWGELTSLSAQNKKIAGVVIDGGVRDIYEVNKLKFPVWSNSVVPHTGDSKGKSQVDIPIQCGGQRVNPGDWIVADESGVVVVPQGKIHDIILEAQKVSKKEEVIKNAIKKGDTLLQLLKK